MAHDSDGTPLCEGEDCAARLIHPLSVRYGLCAECRLLQRNERGTR